MDFNHFLTHTASESSEAKSTAWLATRVKEGSAEWTAFVRGSRRIPYLSKDQIRSLYNLEHSVKISRYVGNPERYIETLQSLVEFGIDNSRTLSVGCGRAYYEIFLASQRKITREIVCTDFSVNALRDAQALARKTRVRNIEFQELEGGDIAFEEAFSQVWIFDSLGFMDGWLSCIRGSARALKDGGRLFVSHDEPSPRVSLTEGNIKQAMILNGMSISGVGYGTPVRGRQIRNFIMAVKN